MEVDKSNLKKYLNIESKFVITYGFVEFKVWFDLS
jgi:hypothetical protein